MYEVINNALNYTKNISIYGCSIFRNISKEELNEINKKLYNNVNELIKDIDIKSEVLILADGDHLYWYNNAGYKLNR